MIMPYGAQSWTSPFPLFGGDCPVNAIPRAIMDGTVLPTPAITEKPGEKPGTSIINRPGVQPPAANPERHVRRNIHR
jgi:hypothetical protein